MKFIIILILIFIVLFILLFFFLFYIINIFLKKNLEFFNKGTNGLICGTSNEICNLYGDDKSNCCPGYTCMRPNGNYEYKVCIDNRFIKTNKNIGSVNNEFQNFFKNFFLFGSKINNNHTFCEDEEIELKLKDMCNNPYKLNLDGLLSLCKIKMPFTNESEEEDDNVLFSKNYTNFNDRKNCFI